MAHMDNPQRRLLLQAAGVGALAACFAQPAWAQTKPLSSARVIVGFSSGGTADVVGRRAAEKLQPGYASGVYLENKTGAGGQIAVQHVKNAAPDGVTILITPMSMLGIYPHIYKQLPYDPIADLIPVSTGALFEYGFSVGPAVPASITTVPQFLDWCKANPEKANFGSPAPGSTPHFIGALLGHSSGVALTQIPFRGSQPAALSLIAGQIFAVSSPLGDVIQFVKAGKCRLLATSGAQRSRFTPDVPTLKEQGFTDMVFHEWFGFFLPAKTPQAIVQNLNAALKVALATPQVIESYAAMSLEAHHTSPEELASMLKADLQRWEPLVKKIGFTVDA